jgi:hypothetical protein
MRSHSNAAHSGAGDGVELNHLPSVVEADKETARMNQQAERRTAEVLLPRDREARELHAVDIAWSAVCNVGEGAIRRDCHRHRVCAD